MTILVASRVLFQDFHKNIWNIWKGSAIPVLMRQLNLNLCADQTERIPVLFHISLVLCVFAVYGCVWMVVFACMKVHMGAYTCWCRWRLVVDIWNPPQFHFRVFYIKTGSLHETPNYR